MLVKRNVGLVSLLVIRRRFMINVIFINLDKKNIFSSLSVAEVPLPHSSRKNDVHFCNTVVT